MDKETTSQPKLVLAPTGLTRDDGSGAMLKLYTCRLAHAHLLLALGGVSIHVHVCMKWAHTPLTTYMYMY